MGSGMCISVSSLSVQSICVLEASFMFSMCFFFFFKQKTAYEMLRSLVGSVVKDPVQDDLVWREYLETVVKERSDWKDLYRACREVD